MITFILGAALMAAAALLLLLPPLLGKRGGDGVSREALNIAIYRDRLEELERDLAAGLVDDGQYEAAKRELQRDLLVNRGEEGGEEEHASGRWVVPLVGLGVPLLAAALYAQLGETALLESPPVAAGHQSMGGEPAPMEMDDMVGRLAARLEDNPQDAEGWRLLARSYAVMERFDEAAGALARAEALLGDIPDLRAERAELLSMAQGGRVAGEPLLLLDEVLSADPSNQRALWLRGIGSAEEGDFLAAVDFWARLLRQLEPGSPVAQVVDSQIQQAREHMGTATAPPESAAAPIASGAEVKVEVSLAPALAGSVDPHATLFVFARAPDGPPMPLAVARHPVETLPLSVTLDDSLAMMSGRSLENFETVEVVARVSKGGSVKAEPGDLEGSALATVGAAAPVAITIDRVIE